MRKGDYVEPQYARSEWRHAVSLRSVRKVRIYGLRIESSGGDGIYLGVSGNKELPRYSEDVLISEVVLTDNHRQGISVVAARGLLVENTEITRTRGTSPQAGIDFEPNQPEEEISNCIVRGCRIVNNAGAGLQVYLRRHDESSSPVSITVQDSVIRGNTLQVWITDAGGSPRGTIVLANNDIGWPTRIAPIEGLNVRVEE
jgi:hypothetical protein